VGTAPPGPGRAAGRGLSAPPIEPFHERVARVALEVANRYGFVDALLQMARRVDPALEDEDVTRAAHRLDRTPDRAFGPYALTPAEIDQLRARFDCWPR
jgi:hypothetical protein